MIDHADNIIDLNAILHPGSVYEHPRDVVADPTISLSKKRAILASWASDACAVEAAPALRKGAKAPVPFDDIMEALRALDKQANAGRYRNPFGLRSRLRFSRNDNGDQGRSLQ